jgi:hypothetical protein
MSRMQRSGTKALVVGFVVVAGLAIAWWMAGDKRGDTRISLSFVALTNFVQEPDFSGSGSRTGILSFSAAILRLTNGSATAVTAGASVLGNTFQREADGTLKAPEGFVFPSSSGLPRLLGPGETTLVLAKTGDKDGAWWTEFSYRRSGVIDRAYSRLCAAAPRSIRRLLLRFRDPHKLYPTRYYHSTNSPLESRQ